LFSVFVYAYRSDNSTYTIKISGCKELDEKQLGDHTPGISCEHFCIDLQQVKPGWRRNLGQAGIMARPAFGSDHLRSETHSNRVLEMHGNCDRGRRRVLLASMVPGFGKLDVPVLERWEKNRNVSAIPEENTARIRQAMLMMSEIASGSPQYAKIVSSRHLNRNNLKIIQWMTPKRISATDYLKRFQKFVNNPSEYQKLKSQYSEIERIDLRFDRQIVYRLKQAEMHR
jgi:hypothetical protein